VRRVRRILLKSATVFSLVLLIVTLALWVRSYFVCEHLTWRAECSEPNSMRSVRWSTLRGAIDVEVFRISDPRPHPYIRFEDGSECTYGQEDPRNFANRSGAIVPWVLTGSSADWPDLSPRSYARGRIIHLRERSVRARGRFIQAEEIDPPMDANSHE
jgi:hypothetical protein